MTAPACTWSEDSDGNWWTACNRAFTFIESGPDDNGMIYCCYCGGRLIEKTYTEEESGDD